MYLAISWHAYLIVSACVLALYYAALPFLTQDGWGKRLIRRLGRGRGTRKTAGPDDDAAAGGEAAVIPSGFLDIVLDTLDTLLKEAGDKALPRETLRLLITERLSVFVHADDDTTARLMILVLYHGMAGTGTPLSTAEIATALGVRDRTLATGSPP